MVERLQVGISRCMRERNSLHDLTCLWQSTVVMLVAISLLVPQFGVVCIYSIVYALGFDFILVKTC